MLGVIVYMNVFILCLCLSCWITSQTFGLWISCVFISVCLLMLCLAFPWFCRLLFHVKFSCYFQESMCLRVLVYLVLSFGNDRFTVNEPLLLCWSAHVSMCFMHITRWCDRIRERSAERLLHSSLLFKMDIRGVGISELPRWANRVAHVQELPTEEKREV